MIQCKLLSNTIEVLKEKKINWIELNWIEFFFKKKDEEDYQFLAPAEKGMKANGFLSTEFFTENLSGS